MLEPLVIMGYKDEKFSQSVGEYKLQINPESYTHNHETAWKTDKDTTGQAGVRFDQINPETLSFSFYIDATGILAGGDGSQKKYRINSVTDEIIIFKKMVYSINGEIHTPNYLILFWGKLKFKCRLVSLNVEYTLFNPSGIPLRAKLAVNFKQFLSSEEQTRLAGKSSPDLTHARTVMAGDTLPLMCHRIYGDSRYYLEIARVNGLKDFRNLEPGIQIIFPPLAN
ncbi:CIS tube protein [Methylomagnum sp.]